jgi:hypothetical protein
MEYMIENDDLSNYKQRRYAFKGDRMSRTLSKSGSKTNNYYMHNHKKSVPNLIL